MTRPRRGEPGHLEWVVGRVREYLASVTDPRAKEFLRWDRERAGGGIGQSRGIQPDYVCERDLAAVRKPWRDLVELAGGRARGAPGPGAPQRPAPLPADVQRVLPPTEAPKAPPVPVRPVDFSALDFDDDPTATDVEPAHERAAARRYVVTYAQNATPVDDNFLASLLVYCEHRGARLVVLPGRYKNPTSVWSQHQESDEWWDARLAPYLYRGRLRLTDDLIAYGDISIQPTAIRPLTGFEVFSGGASAIFGHPKIQLRAVAAPRRDGTRVLTTTGAVTAPNYTDSRAGKRGEAHHVQGACVVEIDADDRWHIRQINATDDGSFIELGELFSPEGVEPAPPPLALVLGDVHVSRVEPSVVEATLRRPDSIARTLQPEQVLYHDLLDFEARNHHSIDDPDQRFIRAMGGAPDLVEAEVEQAIRFVDEETPEGCTPVVVASNHDEAFDRWLRCAEPKRDPVNARFYHQMRAAVLERYERERVWPSAFALAYERRGSGRARLLRRGETYTVGGVELAFHGDHGVNGARGSALGYARLAAKVVIGHSHTPQILDGVYQVGVSGQLDMGYNSTPSSWMHAHCLVYANGKRTLVFIRGESWRAE